MSGPVRPERDQVDSQARWHVAAVGAGLAILLLLAANVQLWRVADRAGDGSDDAPATAEIPPLPKTDKGGSQSLLRSLEASEEELRTSLSGIQSAVAGAAGGAGSAQQLVSRLDTLSRTLRTVDDGSPEMAQVTDQLRSLTGELRDLEELQGLTGELRKLGPARRDLRTLSANTGRVTDEAGRVTGEVGSLRAAGDSIGARMGALSDRLDTLRGEIDSLDGQLTGLSGSVTTLDGRMAEALPLLERGVGGLDIVTEFFCRQLSPPPTNCPPPPDPEPEPEP